MDLISQSSHFQKRTKGTIPVLDRAGFWERKGDRELFYILPSVFEDRAGNLFELVADLLKEKGMLVHDQSRLQKRVRVAGGSGREYFYVVQKQEATGDAGSSEESEGKQ
jgi:Cch helix turn helix domain